MKYNFGNRENQKITQEYIENNVYCNVTSMVEYILNEAYEGNNIAPFSWDDVEGETYYIDEDREEIPKEIYQWLAVSDEMARDLLKHGGIVIYDTGCGPALWGRTTFGQACCMDGIIWDICGGLGWLK